jgi:hypothetical protein
VVERQNQTIGIQMLKNKEVRARSYVPIHDDSCIYRLNDPNGTLISLLLLYVNDVLIASTRDLVDKLKSVFPFTNMGPAKYVLGYEIERDIPTKTKADWASERIVRT